MVVEHCYKVLFSNNPSFKSNYFSISGGSVYKRIFSPIFGCYWNSAWNCLPMFNPQSRDCLLFQTSTFQPREGSQALPHTQTPLTPPLAEKSWFETKDNPMTTE